MNFFNLKKCQRKINKQPVPNLFRTHDSRLYYRRQVRNSKLSVLSVPLFPPFSLFL